MFCYENKVLVYSFFSLSYNFFQFLDIYMVCNFVCCNLVYSLSSFYFRVFCIDKKILMDFWYMRYKFCYEGKYLGFYDRYYCQYCNLF